LLCLAASALLSGRRSAPAMMLTAGLVIDSTPLIVVAPILGIWVGFGFGAHIALSVMASLYPLLVGLLRGLEEVDPQARELFDIIGAGRLQRWWKLELPSARPFLFTALKAAAPLALLGALVGEWVGAERGLGVMMVYALFGYDVALAWALVIVVCAVALLYHGVLSLLDRATARLHGEPAA
jgi:ABC-type nitrate/sulfonate/bicarbonate transport system permease component